VIDVPGVSRSQKRVRRGVGCLAVILLAPMAFGCLHIAWTKLQPFAWAIFILLGVFVGAVIWLSRQR
jgi:hypothetical protein